MAKLTPKPVKSKRIVAFDVLRGYFLLVILINHIELPPNGFDLFTGRGRLFVSAAEGFFFMSGLLVGIVYKRRLHLGLKFIFRKMWVRALELYAGSVFLTLLFTAAAVYLHRPGIKQGLWYPVTNWWHVIGQSLLMTYNFGWADFLDRFALMMLIAPLGFWLLTKRKWWLVALGSFALWAGPGDNNPWDAFNWQIIFMGAMILGYHWADVQAYWASLVATRRRTIKRWVVGLSALTFGYSYLSVYVLSMLNDHLTTLPQGWQSFTLHWNSFHAWIWQYAQKWTVGPLRLVLFGLWFWALFMLVNRYYGAITRYSRGVVEMVGQNSLFVYITHAFIVFIFKLFIPSTTPFWQNFLYTAGALGVLIGVTKIYIHHRPALHAGRLHIYNKLPFIPANIES